MLQMLFYPLRSSKSNEWRDVGMLCQVL